MPYGFPSSSGQFLNAFAEGFRRTRLDDLLFILLVVVVLLLVAAYFVAQRVLTRRELARRSQAVLERLAGRIVPSGEEAALLGRLTVYLHADQSAGALLRDHRVFDACARAMARAEPVSGDLLNALRLKIGFRITQPAEMPASTVEIPEGSTIILVTGNGKRARGKLRAQGQGSLMIQLDRPGPVLRPNLRGTAYFHNTGGVYSFPTRISTVLPDGVRIAQSENVVRHQRRRYYRTKISLAVLVKPAVDSGVFIASVLVDLSAGGASIRCPRALLDRGDLLEISFSPSGETLVIAARVIRVTGPGSIIHVQFESLGDAERARIMGFLFAQSSSRKTPA